MRPITAPKNLLQIWHTWVAVFGGWMFVRSLRLRLFSSASAILLFSAAVTPIFIPLSHFGRSRAAFSHVEVAICKETPSVNPCNAFSGHPENVSPLRVRHRIAVLVCGYHPSYTVTGPSNLVFHAGKQICLFGRGWFFTNIFGGV